MTMKAAFTDYGHLTAQWTSRPSRGCWGKATGFHWDNISLGLWHKTRYLVDRPESEAWCCVFSSLSAEPAQQGNAMPHSDGDHAMYKHTAVLQEVVILHPACTKCRGKGV